MFHAMAAVVGIGAEKLLAVGKVGEPGRSKKASKVQTSFSAVTLC